MDRRDSIKSLLIGSIAGGMLINGCAPTEVNDAEVSAEVAEKHYGRTEKEKILDEKIKSEIFFTEHELATIAVLCDLILPATQTVGGALDAGVPEFVEFIVKDIPKHQLPLRGGIMWLDNVTNKQFGLEFISCNVDQQKAVLDTIAWPVQKGEDPAAKEKFSAGIRFFSLMRDLTLTGYYTTKIGIEDLGYVGNTPAVWDGVPEDVLKQQGLAYDEEWLAKCVDQTKRADIAQWDDEGNLIS